MPQVAVVILNYNGREHLKSYLPSVVRYSTPHEIIVADNASTDDSIHFLKENYPDIRLIELKENTGYTGGYNRALEQIESDYAILLNSDIEVTDNWINPIINQMESDKSIAAAQPKILSWKEKGKFEYAGASGGFIDKLGYPFCRGRIFDAIENDEHQYDDAREIFWASGACMFVRTSAFKDAGGLDEEYFAHMEEIDLCWRFRHQGLKAMVFPESTVYHLGGGTLDYGNPRKTYLNFRNNLFTLYKNLPAGELGMVFIARFILDFVAIFQFAFKGKTEAAQKVFQAWGAFMSARKRLKERRKQIQPSAEFPSTVYTGSIVVEHFIRHKKRFKDIQI